MGLGSGVSAVPTGSIYHRSYAPLKTAILSFFWRALTVTASFFTVLYTLPWQAVKAIAPGGMKTAMVDVEHTVLNFLTPILNFFQDAWYQLFSIADNVASALYTNLVHFYFQMSRDVGNISNRILSFLENRTSLMQDFGIYAFPLIFHAGLAPNALSTTPGLALGAAKGVLGGVTNRIARAGDAITSHPAGHQAPGSLAQGFSNVY